jgi:hypothetical protein
MVDVITKLYTEFAQSYMDQALCTLFLVLIGVIIAFYNGVYRGILQIFLNEISILSPCDCNEKVVLALELRGLIPRAT